MIQNLIIIVFSYVFKFVLDFVKNIKKVHIIVLIIK